MQDKFHEKTIDRHSAILNIQADEYRPNWFQSFVRRDHVADEIEYFQYGDSADNYFNTYLPNKVNYPSSWSKFPTEEDPYTKYKFTSMEVDFSMD